ncbi:unnamed protein product [Linum trigynum]|uniref:Uncharacterized protein n=1 Tax=Linum trigynum TaxID=586398 RepID=A0AAV2E9T8_9ROSI
MLKGHNGKEGGKVDEHIFDDRDQPISEKEAVKVDDQDNQASEKEDIEVENIVDDQERQASDIEKNDIISIVVVDVEQVFQGKSQREM